MTDAYIELVTKSAPLHDIGKVGIPDHVLLKAGRLDENEWSIMKTHAELGARAIERAEQDVETPITFFRLAKEIDLAIEQYWWLHRRWRTPPPKIAKRLAKQASNARSQQAA